MKTTLARRVDDARIEITWKFETFWKCKLQAKHQPKFATAPYCFRCGRKVYLQTGSL